MEKDLLPLIEILNQRWEEARKGKTVLLLLEGKDPVARKLGGILLKTLRNPPPEEYFLEHDFAFTSLWGPFDPFLTWIKNFFQDAESFSRFLIDCNIYPPHQELLSSYYSLSKARRKEDVLTEEFSYEKKTFQLGLIKMLKKLILRTGPLVVILDNLPMAGPSLIRFIKLMADEKEDLPLLLVGTTDPAQVANQNLDWEDFIQKLKNRDKWYLLRDSETPSQEIPTLKLREEPVVPALNDVQNLLSLFCVHEALAESQKLLKSSSDQNIIDQETRFGLLLVIAEALGFLGDWDNAILNLQVLHQEAQISRRHDFLFHANRLLALMYFRKDEIGAGMRHTQQSLHLAQELESPSFLAGAYQLIFLAKEDIAEIFFEYKDLYLTYFSKLVELLEQLNWTNSLSYLYTRAIYLILFIWDKGSEDPLTVCLQGLKLAKVLKNQFRLGVAWHSIGMIYQDRGEMEKAQKAYKKSLRLRKGLQSLLERSRILNGLGYFHLNLGEYLKSWKFYKKALRILKDTHEYEEICATLYNLGALCFFSHDWKGSIYYLKKALKIMNVLKIENLPYSHRSDFYSLLGMALLKLNKYSQAYGYMQRIEALDGVKKKVLDFEFYNLFRGMLHRSKDALGTASRELQELLGRTSETAGKFRLLRAEAWNELLLCQDGAPDSLGPILSQVQEEFKKAEGLNDFKKWFENFPHSHSENFAGIPFPKIRIQTDSVITLAQKDLNLNILHKKLREIQFLNNLQQTLLDTKTQEGLIQSVMTSIQESYPTEFIYLFLEDNEAPAGASFPWKLFYIVQNNPKTDPDPHQFIKDKMKEGHIEESLFGSPSHRPQGIFLPLTDGGTVKGFLVMGSSQSELTYTEDDLRTLILASRQFLMAWELRETQDQLVKAATTDTLTGVFNRGEFQKRFELEMKRAKRQSEKSEVQLSLLFMDLDNFKFFNDTYGHDAGDLILRQTGELLRQSCREQDIIGRFGGDEFVIFLPDTGLAGSEALAERITEGYKGKEAPGAALEKGKKNRVTCSIGLVTLEGALTETASELLIKADKALYEAKDSGKNTWKRWKFQ